MAATQHYPQGAGMASSSTAPNGNARTGRQAEAENRDIIPLRCLIPPEVCSAVIGKSGATIKQLNLETGCQVDIERPSSGQTSRLALRAVSISSRTTPGARFEGLRGLLSKLEAFELSRDPHANGESTEVRLSKDKPKKITLHMAAPSSCIPPLIGSKGGNVKKISSASSTFIRVDEETLDWFPPHQTVRIIGAVDNVVEAAKTVQSYVDEAYGTGRLPLQTMGAGTGGRGGPMLQPWMLSQRLPPGGHVIGYRGPGAANSAMAPGRGGPNYRVGVAPSYGTLLQVPRNITAWLVGAKGRHIKDIQALTGAQLRLHDSTFVRSTGDDFRVIEIAGSADAKRHAMRHIIESMNQHYSSQADTDPKTYLLVEQRLVSELIGRKGATVAAMVKATGARIALVNFDKTVGAQQSDEGSAKAGPKRSVGAPEESASAAQGQMAQVVIESRFIQTRVRAAIAVMTHIDEHTGARGGAGGSSFYPRPLFTPVVRGGDQDAKGRSGGPSRGPGEHSVPPSQPRPPKEKSGMRRRTSEEAEKGYGNYQAPNGRIDDASGLDGVKKAFAKLRVDEGVLSTREQFQVAVMFEGSRLNYFEGEAGEVLLAEIEQKSEVEVAVDDEASFYLTGTPMRISYALLLLEEQLYRHNDIPNGGAVLQPQQAH